jgi:hypothetical protein
VSLSPKDTFAFLGSSNIRDFDDNNSGWFWIKVIEKKFSITFYVSNSN